MRAVVGALALVVAAFAQAPQQDGGEKQQEAYRHWRATEPNLERDAVSAGATLGARADKVAAEAAKYFVLRKDHLDSRAADLRRSVSPLEPVNVASDALPNLEKYLEVQDAILRSSINTIAQDPDRAIQQLRASLERERAAIAAIGVAVKDSQNSQEAAAMASRAAEQARARTSEEYQKLATGLQESARLVEKTGTEWAGYYRALSDAARGAAAPVTSSGPALPSAGREPNAAEPGTPAASNPTRAPAATTRSVTPVPLARYVGEWTYPGVGAHYHGLRPESADLVVREENGQASGSLAARFRLPAGSSENPVVRFNFTGAFGNSRTQKFAATTSSGAKGTLELIPGPAFNLLEVNFNTHDQPGMIGRGNFLLIKQ
ncbi:MAG: hypothetical protein ABI833_02295 [Acidobacteriota bacterium]